MPINKKYIVDIKNDGLRLDRWFRYKFPFIGFNQIQKFMRKGQIRLNGRRVKSDQRISKGQEIQIPDIIEKPANKSIQNKRHILDFQLIEENTIYRDESILILNKPSGLAVQGGTATIRDIDSMLRSVTTNQNERPRLVHRLDKDTSGILIVGLTLDAARFLHKAFRDRHVRKLYWAVINGFPNPASGIIDIPIIKSESGSGNHKREKVLPDYKNGKKAITNYTTQETFSRLFSWVSMEPITGRTHQLRVHTSVMGHPIIGDLKYGGKSNNPEIHGMSNSLHLHAVAVRFPHPNGGVMVVDAPLPKHMADSFRLLGFCIPKIIDFEKEFY